MARTQGVENRASNKTKQSFVIFVNHVENNHFHEKKTYFTLIDFKYILRICCNATDITSLIEQTIELSSLSECTAFPREY